MTIRRTVSDTTEVAGSDNAAELQIGLAMARDFDVYYDVSANGDIVIEVTEEADPAAGDWKEHDTIDTADDGQENIVQASTMFERVRAYADGVDFADADVDEITIASREMV